MNKGEVVALVGASGSGKTTLSNLLIRLSDPSSGAVLVNGTNLRDLDLHTWRSSLGVVTQEATLFNDSVYNNICLTDSTPDDCRVKESAEIAQVLDFTSDMPNGLLTEVGDGGGRLSGGQRQRVALARAIYRSPEVIILDEATSALDAQSEAAVQTALDATMKGRTVLVIAHRLSTVKHADKIIVLDKGEIVESGTHDELIKLQGQYHKLVTLQSFSS